MFIGVMILLKLFSEVCGEFAHEQSRNIFMTGKVFQSFLYYSASSGVVSRRSQFFVKMLISEQSQNCNFYVLSGVEVSMKVQLISCWGGICIADGDRSRLVTKFGWKR